MCELLDVHKFLIPKSVDYSASQDMFKANITPTMKDAILTARAAGWVFYAVNQTRGRCHYRSKVITIPVWALVKSILYKQWYISHELSHVFAVGDNHGQKFMAQLIRICPPEAIHFELNYKPRNAGNAGIVNPESFNF